jgi:hypothetical protein
MTKLNKQINQLID